MRHKLYPILSDNIISSFRAELVGPHDVDKFHKFLNGDGSTERLKKGAYEYFHLTTDREAIDCLGVEGSFKKAANMIRDTVRDKKLNFYRGETYSMNKLIAKEFKKLGFAVNYAHKMVCVNVNFKNILFQGTVTPSTSLMGARVLKDKGISRELLRKLGISVAKGQIFGLKQKEQAKHFALSLPSAVVKPVDGNRAKGVTVGVKSSSDFIHAWDSAVKSTRRGVLIEEQFVDGVELRCLVLNQKYIAAFTKLPPHVLGNGIDTLSKLIEKKNEDRLNNPHLRKGLIKIDKHRLAIIKSQGFGLSSIPPKGAVIIIDWKANTSTGGDSVDVTDEVHPSFREIAESVAGIVPGLDIVGVDIIAYDYMKEMEKGNYIVIEGNTLPGIGAHHYPAYGRPRNVAKKIVEYILEKHN
ncbi:MAG: hypothetical protein GX957_15885 [Clostridiaceae bacterium]|nr:hypothetical protein [Clostridiaceae bacterium]